MEKNTLITSGCYAVAVILCVAAFFFDKPVNLFVGGCALICMFRVIAVTILQKLSWKTLVWRLTLTAFIAAELSAFYGCKIALYAFSGLFCVGGFVSFVNAIIFINSMSGDTDIDKA